MNNKKFSYLSLWSDMLRQSEVDIENLYSYPTVDTKRFKHWLGQFIHNVLAHPCMGLTNGSKWSVRFHDYTAKLMEEE